jgi:hypothetical protein
VYPKYETKGELAQASEAFLEWYVGISAKKKKKKTPGESISRPLYPYLFREAASCIHECPLSPLRMRKGN